MPTLRPRKRPAGVPANTSPTVTSTAPASSSASSSTTLKKRVPRSVTKDEKQLALDDKMSLPDEERLLLDTHEVPDDAELLLETRTWAQRNQWIFLALASGACAACNGVFAKLTTTKLTASFSMAVARVLGLENIENVIELIVRGSFFGLNLAFNGVMWTLFTKALARGNSTTQVSIMNTSTNFVITAILGLAIFSESLPPLWWVGAAMLVAGNVIIGRKDEGVSSSSAGRVEDGREVQMGEVALPASGRAGEEEGEGLLRNRREGEGVEKDEDVPDLGSALEEM